MGEFLYIPLIIVTMLGLWLHMWLSEDAVEALMEIEEAEDGEYDGPEME